MTAFCRHDEPAHDKKSNTGTSPVWQMRIQRPKRKKQTRHQAGPVTAALSLFMHLLALPQSGNSI